MRLARQRLRTPKSDRPTRILSFWAAKLSRFSSTRAAVTVVNTRYDQIGTVTDSDAILPQTTSVGWQTKDQTIRRLDGADRCKTDGRRKTSSRWPNRWLTGAASASDNWAKGKQKTENRHGGETYE